MKLGVSVIICSYNSADRLPQTLKHLALQKVDAQICWEIIVINNGSTDDTKRVALQEWEKYNVPYVSFKVVDQTIPGKINAVEKGVKESNYDYVLICDDDNWLNNDYITKAFQIMRTDNKIGATGGQGFAVTDEKLPEWFETFQHAYAVGKQSAHTGNMLEKEYLWGAGMVFKKQLYEKAYSIYAPLLIGPRGHLLTRGEDIELCLRIILLGYTLFYDETLVYKHYLTGNRLTEEYRDRLHNGNTEITYILNLYFKQFQINKMSILQKGNLLFLSITRFLVCEIKLLNKWNTAFECEIIYLLTGFELHPISDECKLVRKVYLQSKLSYTNN